MEKTTKVCLNDEVMTMEREREGPNGRTKRGRERGSNCVGPPQLIGRSDH